MKERIVIIFIAVTLGLVATTVGFFVYESSKPAKNATSTPPLGNNESNPNQNTITLNISEPTDESITNNRNVRVRGKTDPENTIIISTNQEDVAIAPTNQGDFTASVSIDTGVNKIIIQAITPDGNKKEISQTISFSSEEF
jgi:hypothetical protein